MFKTRAAAASEVTNWTGGIDYTTLEKAERHAIGWHYYLKDIAKASGVNIRIFTNGFNTTTGLSKFPYLRDTRRTIGVDNYVMLTRNIRAGPLVTGTRFADRVALGAYPMDFHPTTCKTTPPAHLDVALKHDTLPYYFPLRAFTNRDVGNLIMSGKTLATSYAVSSATRLQPQEYSTGIASGAIASHMCKQNIMASADILPQVAQIRTRIQLYAPTEWTISGSKYPNATEPLEPIPDNIACPDGAQFDHGYGYCVAGEDAFGPFSDTMIQQCSQYAGTACSQSVAVTFKGQPSFLLRWKKQLALQLRGEDSCAMGTARRTDYANYCVGNVNGTAFAFGPFASWISQRCVAAQGGTACNHTAIRGSFFLNMIK